MIVLQPGTREYLGDWPVVLNDEVGDDVEAAGVIAQLAAVAAGTPGEGDWRPAVWILDTQPPENLVRSQDTYGAAGSGATVTLEPGVYRLWLRLQVGDEQPVLALGRLNVRAG